MNNSRMRAVIRRGLPESLSLAEVREVKAVRRGTKPGEHGLMSHCCDSGRPSLDAPSRSSAFLPQHHSMVGAAVACDQRETSEHVSWWSLRSLWRRLFVGQAIGRLAFRILRRYRLLGGCHLSYRISKAAVLGASAAGRPCRQITLGNLLGSANDCFTELVTHRSSFGPLSFGQSPPPAFLPR